MAASSLFLTLLPALLLGGPVQTFEGVVKISYGGPIPVLEVKNETLSYKVKGKNADELMRLPGALVSLEGEIKDKIFTLSSYRLKEVTGGRKPIVGWVVPAGDSMLALRDGDGEPILLNLSPRAIRHLKSRLGAKIWVAGKSLVSGQYKVQRYGILRDPPKLEKKKGDPGCPIKETCKPGT